MQVYWSDLLVALINVRKNPGVKAVNGFTAIIGSSKRSLMKYSAASNPSFSPPVKILPSIGILSISLFSP